MKVSLNYIKQFTDFDLPSTNELVARINQQLGGVEEVIDLSDQYKDALIVSILNVTPHPNANRLNVVNIDDGGVTKDVPRESDGSIQVVCGAPNVHEQTWAVWLPPKSIVPATYHDDEPFVLGARELRGVMSQGMLAAPDELGIGTSHDGILLLTQQDTQHISSGKEIKAGTSFAEAYRLDDTIIDIENKMFTHRPDLFGQLGVAREIAGILGQQFKSPDWYLKVPEFETVTQLELEVFNDEPENVPRFMATAMNNVEIKSSPLWLQCALVTLGSKPINNIVDITNYIMLITAQPVHAYDYDKIRGLKIGARMAKSGETVKLLNNKIYQLSKDDIVIADAEGPIGLAGIMGGGDSEVDENTKNVVLEVGTFDMYTLRKSSMRHGVFTDALTRFNKGQSPLQNDRVMKKLMEMMSDLAGARQASNVLDHRNKDLNVLQYKKRVTLGSGSENEKSVFSRGNLTGVIPIENAFINTRLGLNFSPKNICELLRLVEIKAHEEPELNTPNLLEVIAPFWRTDLEISEDIVEEVGRLYGFDKLPRELPVRSTKPTPANELFEFKSSLRNTLKSFGANELLTYSFVHEKLLQKAEQNSEHAYKLSNALSPDLQYYRLSLLPSLLEKAYANLKTGYDQALLYEIGKAHDTAFQISGELQKELELLEMVHYSKKSVDGAMFYQMRRTLVELLNVQHIADYSIESVGLEDCKSEQLAPYEPSRTAKVIDNGGEIIAVFGELKQSVIDRFKLPVHVAAATIYLQQGLARKAAHADYWPLSRFPSITQDVSIEVEKTKRFNDVLLSINRLVASLNENYRITITPRSVYLSDQNSTTKTITLRFVVSHDYKTLDDSEVQTMLNDFKQAAQTIS